MNKKTVVIIGGGTAGLVIANNLQKYFNVIIIEKSRYLNYPKIYKIPLLIGILFRSKNSKYISKRSLNLTWDREIPFFESNVLGGSSVINGCVHVVGSKAVWHRILNKFDSNYEELIASYNSLYTMNRDRGAINLRVASRNKLDQDFIKTLNILGIPNGDTNYLDEPNCGSVYNTAGIFLRSSVFSLIKKINFKIFANEEIEEIIPSEDNKVHIKTNKRQVISDYVIFSSGVIGTSRILLKSQKINTAKLYAGQEIKDHVNLRVNVLTNCKIESLNEIESSVLKKLFLLLKHFQGRKTLMIGTGATSAVHLDLDDDGEIDTRINLVQFTETGRHGSDGRFFHDKPGFSLSITPVQPSSKGHIKETSTNLTINPNYLHEEYDQKILILALQYCMKILREKPLSNYIEEIIDENLIKTNPLTYIKNNIFSGHHLIGGANKMIDKNFKLSGFENIYVCDASIFSEYPSSNIHSSVILISDIFSKRFISINASVVA